MSIQLYQSLKSSLETNSHLERGRRRYKRSQEISSPALTSLPYPSPQNKRNSTTTTSLTKLNRQIGLKESQLQNLMSRKDEIREQCELENIELPVFIGISIFTPYYCEKVQYSSSELQEENEDGVSTLLYLQKIFPDELDTFLELIINQGIEIRIKDCVGLCIITMKVSTRSWQWRSFQFSGSSWPLLLPLLLQWRRRNNFGQLYAKDITPDDKRELSEALGREVEESDAINLV